MSINYKCIFITIILASILYFIQNYLNIYKNTGASLSIKGRNGQIATSIFDFVVEDIDSKNINMEIYKGKKVYYIVNVATN